VDIHRLALTSPPPVRVHRLDLPGQRLVGVVALIQACDIVRHRMSLHELERWFPPASRPVAEAPELVVEPLPDPTSELPAWGVRLLEAVHEGERADRLYDLIVLLIEQEGRAHVDAVAATLRVDPADVRLMVRSMGTRVNTEGFPVLAYDADGETVVMNLGAVEQRFTVDVRRFRIFRPGGQSIAFELPFDPTEIDRKALEHLARYQRLSEGELSRLCNTRRIGGVMGLLMERLAKAGWNGLEEEAAGEDGRVFAFRDERL
jgi:hypothetical protein